MKTAMVTTNLRLPKEDLVQYKVLAAELNISFNEFVQRVLKQLEKMDITSMKQQFSQKYENDSFWQLGKMVKKEDVSREYDLSEDDKIIYGIND